MYPLKTTLLIVSIAVGLTLSPLSAAETMTNDQIAATLVGKTLSTSVKGIPARVTYNADGSVEMKALIISGHGTWEYSEAGICVDMTSGPRKGETCLTFTDIGDAQYLNSEGMTFTVKN